MSVIHVAIAINHPADVKLPLGTRAGVKVEAPHISFPTRTNLDIAKVARIAEQNVPNLNVLCSSHKLTPKSDNYPWNDYNDNLLILSMRGPAQVRRLLSGAKFITIKPPVPTFCYVLYQSLEYLRSVSRTEVISSNGRIRMVNFTFSSKAMFF